MNKQTLVDAVAKQTKKPKIVIEEILNATVEVIQREVENDRDVTLMGFGTFLLGKRKASKGFNPHTGKSIEVPEIRMPKFRAGKGFKERLNK
jgi:DNA-binding protein HU-beta